ncbi:cell division protein DedD [Shewanella sp. SR44-3]|uniref:cell division protein DedD n=1 Tax=unclassified Shewanella TaxID=196818 RepID=UPI0015FD374D|nr:cell division protein DedD [Shewanella sp. SR44-3]MBB1270338.1 cell division protein DedD [Shewanella sp. SR44-3]
MTSQFQNRLVGTIVLVALGVIFLPDLLDGKQRKVEEVFTEIPLRANSLAKNTQTQGADEVSDKDANTAAEDEKFQVLSEQNTQPQLEGSSPPISNLKPIKMVDALDLSTAEAKKAPPTSSKSANKPASNTAKTEVKSVSKPAVNKPVSQPRANVTLQLGGFNSADNVVALVAQLRKAGFTTYTLPRNPIDGRLTKVFVGPDVSEAKLKARQVQIEKLTGLKGKIVPYNPLER